MSPVIDHNNASYEILMDDYVHEKPEVIKRNYKLLKCKEAIEFTGIERICIDEYGIPFEPINQFILFMAESIFCSDNTILAYTRQLILFFSYLDITNEVELHDTSTAEAERIIGGFLQNCFQWIVEYHPGGNYIIKKAIPKRHLKGKRRLSRNSLRQAIKALGKYYFFLIQKGQFIGRSPFDKEWRFNKERSLNRKNAPLISGTVPNESSTFPRKINNFCVPGNWKPIISNDPAIKKKIVEGFINKNPVYLLICLILFESGARIHEILSITKDNWEGFHGQYSGAKVINKGSNGEVVKKIYWFFDTEQILQYYLNSIRPMYDKFGRQYNELRGDEKLFINSRGNPVTYPAFFAQWQKVRKEANVYINIHGVRHWFVTKTLKEIKTTIVDSRIRRVYKDAFIQLMHWQNPETINVYDDYLEQSEIDVYQIVMNATKQLSVPNILQKENLNFQYPDQDLVERVISILE